MQVWIDGRIEPADTARIDPRDRGFTLGDGLYETIRVKAGEMVRLDRHFARLHAGLDVLDMPLAVGETALADAMRLVLAANALTEAALRLTVTRGIAARGMAPDPTAKLSVVIAAAFYVAPTPARAVIATVTRRNEHSPISRVKTTSCLDSVLARIEAARRGADDAILLNTAGRVAEATAANLFAMIDGALVTPPVADGALPGVMRGWISETLPVVERPLLPEDLERAEEIFLTSALGIRPVIALDRRAMAAGPVAARLAKEF